MSNNKQSVELTDFTAPLLAATPQGLTMEDCVISVGFLLDRAKRTRGKQPSPSICKVPRIHRDLSVRSFIPQLVSIGPIHRENKKLKEFEWQKERYLDDLLKRFESTPEETLEACFLEVSTLLPKIKESYGMIKKYSDVELARMMVMDGCFILEFCFKHDHKKNLHLPNKMQNVRIALDLILLENQVPFFVLQALFDCSMGKLVSFTLSNLLDKYLAPYIQLFYSQWREEIPTTDVDTDSTHDHVLGYLHRRYQLLAAKSSNREERIEKTAIHSIVELDRSGMKFKPHQENEWSMTIKFQISLLSYLPWFWIKPTLRIPALVIDDTTELILRNFIAYEQSFPCDCYYFTSYVHAMDMLIDTQEDVAILAESKVLFNQLCSNREAADMINKIGENMFVTDFCYTEEFKKMDEYYNCLLPTYKRIYYSNPWNDVNLLVGIILFLATVVATIFAVLDYYR